MARSLRGLIGPPRSVINQSGVPEDQPADPGTVTLGAQPGETPPPEPAPEPAPEPTPPGQ